MTESPFDARPHVLIVYRTPGDDEVPDSRWESPGITSATAFPDRKTAQGVGNTLHAYTHVDFDVIALDQPYEVGK